MQAYADDTAPVAQMSWSYSHAHVIRGFHQTKEHPQAKRIHVASGKIIDFFFDPLTGTGGYVCLQGGGKQLQLSARAYHAFLAIEPSHVFYFCDRTWREDLAHGYNIESVLPGLMSAGRLVRSDKDCFLEPWTGATSGICT